MTEASPSAGPWERLDLRLERGAVELDEVLAIAMVLARHLDELHGGGGVDGGLSPGRIEVCGGEVRLVAKAPSMPKVKAYTAPEVWDGDSGPLGDQFSMAAILYEALCGGRAFPGDDSTRIRAAITTGSRVPLAARVPGLADRVDGVFERALSVAPELRYATCGAFAADLAAILRSSQNEPVLVKKPSVPVPGSTSCGRSSKVSFSWDEAQRAAGAAPISWTRVVLVLVFLACLGAAIAVWVR